MRRAEQQQQQQSFNVADELDGVLRRQCVGDRSRISRKVEGAHVQPIAAVRLVDRRGPTRERAVERGLKREQPSAVGGRHALTCGRRMC